MARRENSKDTKNRSKPSILQTLSTPPTTNTESLTPSSTPKPGLSYAGALKAKPPPPVKTHLFPLNYWGHVEKYPITLSEWLEAIVLGASGYEDKPSESSVEVVAEFYFCDAELTREDTD